MIGNVEKVVVMQTVFCFMVSYVNDVEEASAHDTTYDGTVYATIISQHALHILGYRYHLFQNVHILHLH